MKNMANPNGSDYNTAIIGSENGRHIAMMPHLGKVNFSMELASLSK